VGDGVFVLGNAFQPLHEYLGRVDAAVSIALIFSAIVNTKNGFMVVLSSLSVATPLKPRDCMQKCRCNMVP
jgi:hypothetical protein